MMKRNGVIALLALALFSYGVLRPEAQQGPATLKGKINGSQIVGTVAAVNGGTGLSSFAVGDLLVANTTTTFARLADVAVGQVFTSGGVGALPLFTATPSFTSWTTTGLDTAIRAGIAGATTTAILLTNTTLSTAGAPRQQSPALEFFGHAFNATTVLDETASWQIFNRPTTGNPITSNLQFGYAANGGALVTVLTLTQAGGFQASGLITAPAGISFTGNFLVSNRLYFSTTAPTLTAATFGTGPSITALSGTEGFEINVGTGGTANTGSITFPAAGTGWIVACTDVTNNALFVTSQTGGTGTTATVANYSRTTGLLIAWTASDVLRCTANGY